MMIRSIKDFAKIPSVLECLLMRRRLCNFNFAIVSNNCWAGRLYQDLGLTYTTPFVGLFLYADDFIRLLTNFNSINLTSLRFTDFTRYDFSRNYRKINNADYPIGLIAGDIEIHFLHYHSREEAEAGIIAVAAPICPNGPGSRAVATCSVAGPLMRFGPDDIQRKAMLVIQTATELAALWPVRGAGGSCRGLRIPRRGCAGTAGRPRRATARPRSPASD